jgi:hypothetical protein
MERRGSVYHNLKIMTTSINRLLKCASIFGLFASLSLGRKNFQYSDICFRQFLDFLPLFPWRVRILSIVSCVASISGLFASLSWEVGIFSIVSYVCVNSWTFCHPHKMIPIKSILLDKRSPSNLVPLDKWSPKTWSPWTNGPQLIRSLYFRIPRGCAPGQMEYSRDHLSRGTKVVGDHLSMGTEFWGTICPWGQNWLGTVCPEGPINWGPIVGD